MDISKNMSDSKGMQFVLIHGAWHGAWCWEKVVPLLEAAGHHTHTIDLSGLGEDQTPIVEVTLDAYVSRVVALIISIKEPVVLVGHSMGGMVITQVAEQAPDKIPTLIYLTAFSPKHRETFLQYTLEDEESDVAKYKQINEEEGYSTIAEDRIKECFYGMCSDEDAEKAFVRLRRQALAPLATPLRLSEENYGSVRRCYISCSKDRAITPEMQIRFKGNARVDMSDELDTDHSPFYSCPDELVNTLLHLS
jgi:pimeloyl-ACP methyl ester carboxylesterase